MTRYELELMFFSRIVKLSFGSTDVVPRSDEPPVPSVKLTAVLPTLSTMKNASFFST